jgi:hypothetical protein
VAGDVREFGAGNGSYYLATAFDQIYLQPSGDVGLTGLMYESPFIRRICSGSWTSCRAWIIATSTKTR